MLDNNWFIIDGFIFNDVLTIENILNAFMDSDKKRILFPVYFFNPDDWDFLEWTSEYTKDDAISEEFENFKHGLDSSLDYNKISDGIKSLLYKEYSRLYKTWDESVKEDLYRKFLNDEIDFFDEEFIYSVKEFIAKEASKPRKESINFINERKVLENNVNVSYKQNRCREDNPQSEPEREFKYVWYEPKSKEDLFNVLEECSLFASWIITEDIENFDKYLYEFEYFEQSDFVLAINDRVGDFESRILPKIQEFLSKENIVLTEKEYYERLMTRY